MMMENMNPLGTGLEKTVSCKYDLRFSQQSIETNIIRLTNQIWKLIPMKENSEDWIKQLNTVIIQIIGFKELFFDEPLFLELLGKLEGLRSVEEFEIFRKTVFESIRLLQELKKHVMG